MPKENYDFQQTSLFDFAYQGFRFTKPVRLIELFAGYGSQMMAMERLQKNGLLPLGVESFKICEWAIPSFVAWAKIHATGDLTDYSKGIKKETLAEILSKRGASLDWKTPASFKKLKSKSDAYLRAAYNAMMASHNTVDITRTSGTDFAMTDRENYQVVMTWSFPCQSLSLAGKRAGMDEGSGSESSLGYEVLRILDEMKAINQLPTILVMENVPQFASETNRKNVIKIQDRLDKLGYKSYIKIQSATDFGVPQTRKRCFMLSFLGEYSYQFADGFPLEKKLRDELEENVDEKYYLSRKMMRYVLAKGTKGYNHKEIVNPSIGHTVNANYGRYRAGIDTYVSPDLGDDEDLTVNDKKVINVGNINGHQSGRVFSEEGCAPSVMAHTHGNTRESVLVYDALNRKELKDGKAGTISSERNPSEGTLIVVPGLPIKDATKKGLDFASDGDGVYISNINGKRGTVQHGKIQTIKAGVDVGVVVSVGIDKSSNNPKEIDVANCVTTREDRGVSNHKSEGTAILEIGSYTPSGISGKVVDQAGISPTITTGNNGNTEAVVTKESICLNPKGGRNGKEGLQPSLENRVYDADGCAVALATGFQPKYAIGPDGRIDLSAVYMTDEDDPRFLIWDGKEWRELRIRRLTPRECFRLQDVLDSDFDKLKGFPESILYHLAGDSICVANLYYDFKMMCENLEKGE